MSDNPLASQIPPGLAAYLPIAAGAARTILAALGSAGFTWALAVNADQVQMAVSLAMVLAAALWSGWQKIKAMRALQTAAANPAGIPAPKLPA